MKIFPIYVLAFALVMTTSSLLWPAKESPRASFASDQEMNASAANFDRLFRKVGFLALVGSKTSMQNIQNHNDDENFNTLQSVCSTLVYRMGSKTPMGILNAKTSKSLLSVSLAQEKATYRYLLFRKNPMLWISRYNEGGRYARYIVNPKGSLQQSRQFTEWNKDYLPFSQTISYFMSAAHLAKGERTELQNRKDAVYQKYEQNLCDPNSRNYDDIIKYAQDYVAFLDAFSGL